MFEVLHKRARRAHAKWSQNSCSVVLAIGSVKSMQFRLARLTTETMKKEGNQKLSASAWKKPGYAHAAVEMHRGELAPELS